MPETVTLWLTSEQKTRFAGESLTRTLYEIPLTIFLKGDLGAGKTTFLQGFAQELGVVGPLTSPTYALEQHYVTSRGIPLIHIDLYRLSPADAEHLLRQTDTHQGIRCVEWADRLETIPSSVPHIVIHLEEKGKGRNLEITFRDIPLPTDADIEGWRNEVLLPQNIRNHCDVVADVARRLGLYLLEQGTIVRIDTLAKAAKLHDLLRFLDFKPGATPQGARTLTAREEETWQRYREAYPSMRHEEAASAFLHERGFDSVSSIVRTHGLEHTHSPDATIEQLLLYYADKRVAHDTIVTLQERLDDLSIRYNKALDGRQSIVKNLEASLFPDGPPF